MSKLDNLETFDILGYEQATTENVGVDDLETATPYLCCICIDRSGSMRRYDDHNGGIMSDCLKNFKASILGSKQADEITISRITFGDDVKMKGWVKPENMDCSYSAGGCTALYDAIIAGRKMLLDYMDQIRSGGGTPRGCLVILSDGQNNIHDSHLSDAKRAIEDLSIQEITVAFITFGSQAKGIAQMLGINPKDILDEKNDEHGLRNALNMASKSAISASKRASAGQGAGDMGFFDV